MVHGLTHPSIHWEMLPIIVCFDAKVKHRLRYFEVRVAVNIGKRELKIECQLSKLGGGGGVMRAYPGAMRTAPPGNSTPLRPATNDVSSASDKSYCIARARRHNELTRGCERLHHAIIYTRLKNVLGLAQHALHLTQST